MSDFQLFESWVEETGPGAVACSEVLESIEGPDGVVFPATYAAAEDKSKFAGGYNIDVFPEDERAIAFTMNAMIREGRMRPLSDVFPSSPNVCLIDSVGSQANRIEPVFGIGRYRDLIPQIAIKAGNKEINILRAGHRAGDALVRFSGVGEQIWNAFRAIDALGDYVPMAKIAPTSLLFGAWDSRGTQVKVPRALRSTIRAFNVQKTSRSAQFNRATKFVEEGLIPEDLDVGDGDKNPLSREGFKDSPATASHGGVIVHGEIRRDITVNLAAIRRFQAYDSGHFSDELTRKLRRYILGLALVAATCTTDELFNLREGCLLRQKPETESRWRSVPYRGPEVAISSIDHENAFAFAKAAADQFGVGESVSCEFDSKVTARWLGLKKEEQDKRRRVAPMLKQQFSDDTTSDDERGAESDKKPRGRKGNK